MMSRSHISGLLRCMRVALMVLLCTLPAWQAGAEDEAERIYRLGPGDEVEVMVFGHVDLSGSFEVNGRGEVSLPLIGSVTAGGLTVREFEKAVVAALKPDYLKNPRVSIQVTNYRPFYILGEVNEPGSYPYVDGMSVVNAVALAGGFTYRAKKRHALVKRRTEPEREQKLPISAKVLPGDIITIEERFF